MYEKAPNADMLSAWGFFASDNVEEEIYVWEDCWCSMVLFDALSTQWRTSSGGAVGLDYNVIPFTAEMLGIGKEQLKNAFSDLMIMESEALAIMQENIKNANNS